MKYEIKGIEKGKTIKSVEVIKKSKDCCVITDYDRMGEVEYGRKTEQTTKIIIVNYLDGTQDILNFTAETLKKIENIMTSQAKEYIDKNSKSFWISPTFRLMLVIGAIVCAGYGLCTGLSVPSIVIFGSGTILFGAAATVGTVKAQYVKKYNLFLKKVAGKLNEYVEILRKENELVAKKEQKTAKILGIRELDKTSTKTLQAIVTKVERYNEIDGKTPKIKTL